jgi:hypothetical protein
MICIWCKQDKAKDEFRIKCRDIRESICKKCKNDYSNKNRHNNRIGELIIALKTAYKVLDGYVDACDRKSSKDLRKFAELAKIELSYNKKVIENSIKWYKENMNFSQKSEKNTNELEDLQCLISIRRN